MSSQPGETGATGSVIIEARFDRRIISYIRLVVCGVLLITVVGIPLIPFWLVFTLWYGPEYYRRTSARLTTRAVETRKGVFFRKEATIPLNRITDVRLHDGPVMRYYGLRGLRVETAGQSGESAGSEGDLIGVIDAVEFRDAVLRQREGTLEPEQPSTASPVSADDTNAILTQIRDILTRIEAQGSRD